MSANIAYEKAFKFAIKIVELNKLLIKNDKEYVLSKQILQSGTSIGANIAEANGAISEADFSAKISISYKESLETKYWLSLLNETGYISKDLFEELHSEADELSKILYSLVKNTRYSKPNK